MYKCRLVYDEWKSMKKKTRKGRQVHSSSFEGYVGLLTIEEVSKPQIWKYRDHSIKVLDNGYKWLSILPKEEHYCITVMMNEQYEVQVTYIDMIDEQGIDADGVPYFWDCYLDLIVYPDGNVIEDDRDELDEAFSKGEITKAQYNMAILTAEKLQKGLLKDYRDYLSFVKERLDEIKIHSMLQ